MKQNYLKNLAVATLLFSALNLMAGPVTVKFAENAQNVKAEAFLVKSATETEKLTPAGDGFTYTVEAGSKVRFTATPSQGYVNFVWQTGASASDMNDIKQSYSSTEQELTINSDLTIKVDVCKLVKATFVVPAEATTGPEVNVEEQGEWGRRIEPAADGITYMLPENRGAYFDAHPADGYNVTTWSFGEGAYFVLRYGLFYKQNVPADFYVTVLFHKDGEKRTVTFTQPKTAVLTVKNNSEYGAPTIESGAQVTPGDQILFEIAPFDNPSGKVEVHHWEINGQAYVDGKGQYITDNSLSFMAVENLNVKVIPVAEYTGVNNVREDAAMSIVASAASQTVSVATQAPVVAIYNLQGACMGTQATQNGKAVFHISATAGQAVIVAAGGKAQKVIFN